MTNAKPAASGSTVPVALALLDRWWPEIPALVDQPRADELAGLESNPRFAIGRLQQALTMLMSGNLPAMDAQTKLLSEAIADAIAWRLHDDRPCPSCADRLCERCKADWDQADRYHALARALGAMGDRLPAEPTMSCQSSGTPLMASGVIRLTPRQPDLCQIPSYEVPGDQSAVEILLAERDSDSR